VARTLTLPQPYWFYQQESNNITRLDTMSSRTGDLETHPLPR